MREEQGVRMLKHAPRHDCGVESAHPFTESPSLEGVDGELDRVGHPGGTLHVVRRDAFMGSDDAAELWPEWLHLAHVIAVARDATGGSVVSHGPAGVAWGLPLYRHRPPRVHLTTSAPTRISSGRDVMRHVAPVPESDIVVRHGIRCTSLERTVFDMGRTLGAESAVAAADAGERQFALRGRVWDEDAAGFWRRSMSDRVDAASGARGIRRRDGWPPSPMAERSCPERVSAGFSWSDSAS